MMKRMLVVASLSALPLVSAYAGAAPAASETAAVRESATIDSLRRTCHAAMPQYRATLATTPDDAVTHNLLGTCHQHLGDRKAAKREYELAIKLSPGYAQAYNNLATVFHTQGKYAKAVTLYRAAIERNPDMATAHRNLGTALLGLGKLDEGFAAYAEARRLDPTILDTSSAVAVGTGSATLAQQYFYFAKISARAGQVDAAINFLSKARAAGFRGFGMVRSDLDFKDVVPDQRFAALDR
jgi:tetratricopeptide (TPR) repeat protein